MDAAAGPKLAYWTWAFANMLLLVGLASFGVRRARAGRIAAHRRFMLGAAALVALFVVSYAAKLVALGREPLHAWEPRYVAALRVHEACIAVMLAAGALALWQARSGGFARSVPPRARTRLHRAAGWTALAAGLLGIATAAVVLAGMYQRLEALRLAAG
jgi:uncharacterized membrane protein YozB (DUF420 family)